MPQTWSDWVSLLGILGGLGWWLLEYRKQKRANVNVDADTMTKYASLLESAAKRELAYQGQIDALQNWVKRLSRQVIELGGVPVGLEQGKASGD